MGISKDKNAVSGGLIGLHQNWLKYQKFTSGNIWHQEANTGIKDGAGHTTDNLYEIVQMLKFKLGIKWFPGLDLG
jgi:hypothetical protein